MSTQSETPPSKPTLYIAYTLSALIILLFLFSGILNLLKPSFAVQGTVALGYSENVMTPIGLVLLACTLLYALPKTNILGAILLTGYLGGAVATHVRAQGTWFEIFFPALIGILVWLALYLRTPQLRSLIPLRH
jgi:hypothetical protein